MATGKVKWFDRGSGYGFIQPDDGSEDVFFHQSAFKENNPLSLQKGNQVVFRSEESARGPEAISITVLSVIKAL